MIMKFIQQGCSTISPFSFNSETLVHARAAGSSGEPCITPRKAKINSFIKFGTYTALICLANRMKQLRWKRARHR